MIKTTIWCFFAERPKGLILKNNIELKKEKNETLTRKSTAQDDECGVR
jgi:hypothetical protein